MNKKEVEIIIYICIFSIIVVLGIIRINQENLESIKGELKTSFVEFDYDFMLNRLYKDNARKKVEKRYVITIAALFFGILIFESETITKTLFYSIVSSIIIYKIQYLFVKQKYEKNLKQAEIEFPYYLNALSILMQNNTVAVSLLKSIDTAPAIFKEDIKTLVYDIHQGKKVGVQPFIDFANKFPQVKDLNRIMRTLYNLSITINNKEKIMSSLAKLSNEKVNSARKDKFDKYLDKQALIPWVSFLWVGLVIIAMFSTINLGQII
ncbi:MAG: hypothetical protein RR916_00475 [Anaerorhabdus sp.]